MDNNEMYNLQRIWEYRGYFQVRVSEYSQCHVLHSSQAVCIQCINTDEHS